MTRKARPDGARWERRWRIGVWALAALLWLSPWAAMRVTDAVAWDGADFAIFGALLIAAVGAYELAARSRGDGAYRAAVGMTLATAFLLVWLTLAVGVIGSEDHPANLMVGGVLTVGGLGALLARLAPAGMARALAATALAQALIALIALAAGWGQALGPTGLFVALWLGSAGLFHVAARRQGPAAAP